MSGIEVTAIAKRLGETLVLRDVSLSVAPGDMATEVRRLLPRRS